MDQWYVAQAESFSGFGQFFCPHLVSATFATSCANSFLRYCRCRRLLTVRRRTGWLERIRRIYGTRCVLPIDTEPSPDSSFLPERTGPCNIHTADGPTYNPYSWNTRSNLFFLDEPVGVGFSYAHHGEAVHNTDEAAVDVAAFVGVFFETFKSFEGREFHMSGESYAVSYATVTCRALR